MIRFTLTVLLKKISLEVIMHNQDKRVITEVHKRENIKSENLKE